MRLTHAALLLAADGDGENKKSGPIGLVVIIVLCVVCYFLFKSMSRHLKRVREEFPGSSTPPAAEVPSPADDATDGSSKVPAVPTEGDDPPPS